MFNKFCLWLVVLSILLFACAQTPFIPPAPPPDLNLVLHRQDIQIILHHVILPNGPGSWIPDAPWREYIVTIKNASNYRIFLEAVQFTAATASQFEFQHPFNNPMDPMQYYSGSGWEMTNREFFRRKFPLPLFIEPGREFKRSLFFPASFPFPDALWVRYSLTKKYISSRESITERKWEGTRNLPKS